MAILIRLLGGAPVVPPIPEVYSALDKGVIDGAASPVVSLLGSKWYEVAKYVSQPSFGYTHQLMLMNLNTWKGIPAADQKILLEAGKTMEDTWYQKYNAMAEQEIKDLQAKGVTLTKLGPSPQKLNQVWAEGLWELAEKKSPAEAKELRALAKSKGLTN
jgi:TRAP-type C4-dicarboxylate transport system substrate-binding protein